MSDLHTRSVEGPLAERGRIEAASDYHARPISQLREYPEKLLG